MKTIVFNRFSSEQRFFNRLLKCSILDGEIFYESETV